MYYLQSRYYDPEIRRFISADSIVTKSLTGTNLYTYCGNNPIINLDPLGYFFSELWETFIEYVSNGGSTYALAGAVSQLDSPVPGPADIVGLAIAGGATAYFFSAALVDTVTGFSRPNAREEAQSATLTIEDIRSQTFIYRYGASRPGCLVPSSNDVLHQDTSGLSFSTTPKPNSWCTTIEAINQTGCLVAVQDGLRHVSIYPVGATLEEWRNQGETSIWTVTLKANSYLIP